MNLLRFAANILRKTLASPHTIKQLAVDFVTDLQLLNYLKFQTIARDD